jgi:4-amino-4-deoxy-L-arabinose transferase-like glycosyltransferase
MNQTCESAAPPGESERRERSESGARSSVIVLVAASLIFIANIVSPPRLMDDVDAVQAQIARNMLVSGDWVTARLDGIAYLEKAPLLYWMMAGSYRIFGVHDWAARLPLAVAAVLLCWITYRFGRWAFDEEAGLYAGLALATSAGLFLFTRILIPDAILTLAITGAIWAWLRLIEPEGDARPVWSICLGACLGVGLLLKGLIAIVFPVLAGLVYMAAAGQIFSTAAWRQLRPGWIVAVALGVAAPWHLLAVLRNPPYLVFSLRSGPGQYRGFFWFYFMNEHVLRFLNLRYPRDYNTVPRAWFWLLNLVWMFPWSAYLLAAPALSYQTSSRAGRVRLMTACWIGTVMLFFTFSTTQEYYSMPIYPALALLIGSAISSRSRWVFWGENLTIMLFAFLSATLSLLLSAVWRLPAAGSIASVLTYNPGLYTFSLGHVSDLTLNSFAYLKLPLALAAFGFGVCLIALVMRRNLQRAVVMIAVGMIIFFQAARIALVRFDAYLGSYPLAERLRESPPGQLIEANSYYAFSSVFFYAGTNALLLNGRNNNLEYGSNMPGAPQIFIDDNQFASLWSGPGRCYLLAYGSEIPRLEKLGVSHLQIVATNSGNYLLTNHGIP